MNITFFKNRSNFDEETFINFLIENYGFIKQENNHPTVINFLKMDKVTITTYNSKILFQSDDSKSSFDLVNSLYNLNCLDMDDTNLSKFKDFQRKFKNTLNHNSLYCKDCSEKSNYLINLDVSENSLSFIFNNCHHEIEMNSQLLMVNNRILPDLSVLQARTLSKCIYLGYFKNFEIVIPSFLLDVVDKLSSKNGKKGISKEIDTLRSYENKYGFSIYNCHYENHIFNKEILEDQEDNIILKLAHMTNSILFTQDNILKSKAIVQKRPTLYLDSEQSKNLKKIIENESSQFKKFLT